MKIDRIMQKILFFTVSLLFLLSCKSTQPTRPMERYDALTEEERTSVINIPVRINLVELEKSLNQQLQGTLYEDNDMNDGDKMMMRAEKVDDVKLQMQGQTIRYEVPVKVWVRYNAGITKLEANGEIAMNFNTDFDIDRDWNMETVTNIETYEWLKQPRLRVAGMNLPVGFIADIILKRSKTVITQSIDQQVQENFNLRKMVEDVWKQMFDPVLVSPEYNTWLLVNPQNIGMTPLVTDEQSISSVIVVESLPRVSLGERPEAMGATDLPPFIFRDTTLNDFVIRLRTDVPYEEAERLAKQELLGETFSEGKRSVTIEDLELYGQGNKLIVNTKLSGSYNGSIYLTGRPVYNPKKNVVDIKDLDFTLETRNFLHKSAAWLLKGTLRKRIEENMNFLLQYNLNELKNQLQEQLNNYPITRGIVLDGKLEDLNIQDAFLSTEAIRVDVALVGRLNVQVNGLN